MRRIKELIDGKAAADIRTALLTTANAKGRKITKGDKKIADSTGAANPAATCATADTTGGHGIDVCMPGCEDKSLYLAWTPRKGAFYMLCSLATAPCTNG